jgi:molecular chaperone GrpE
MSERTQRQRQQHAQGNGEDRDVDGRTRAEERIAGLDTSPAALLAQVDELRDKLAVAEREAEENRAGWQRTAADFANYRRRTEQDRLQALGLASEALLVKVLNLADDFDRAIGQLPPELAGQPWVEGIVAIDRKLRQLLDSEGLSPIEAQGAPFDPHQHEAVAQDETARVPEGTVTAELQRGYRLRDRVLRPALVAVAKAPAGTHDNDNQPANREPADAGNVEE